MTDGIETNRIELENINSKLRELMQELGYAFQIAEGSESHPAYAYTTGLESKFGHREIYVVGPPVNTALSLLEQLVSRIESGSSFETPSFIDDMFQFEMPVMPIDGPKEILPASGAVQLFCTDPQGFVPWEEECDPDFSRAQTSLFDLRGPYPSRKMPLEERRRMRARPPEEEIQRRMRDGIERIREQVKEHGFTFQPVFSTSESDGEPFVYSIGLSDTFNHPEMFVVGLNPDDAIRLMLAAIEKVAAGESFENPTFFMDDDGDFFPVRPLQSRDVDQNSGLGQSVLGHGFPAVQIYYPDENGFFPWEAGCDPQYAGQTDMLEPVGEPPNLPENPNGRMLH